MSQFLTTAKLSTLNHTVKGQPLYRLESDLVFDLGPVDGRGCITVPAGRITNLATVPRSWLLRWLYRDIADIDGRFIAAPILHDYLCNERFPGNIDVSSGFTRLEAAVLFRVALASLGAPYWQAYTAYLAVRANDVLMW